MHVSLQHVCYSRQDHGCSLQKFARGMISGMILFAFDDFDGVPLSFPNMSLYFLFNFFPTI